MRYWSPTATHCPQLTLSPYGCQRLWVNTSRSFLPVIHFVRSGILFHVMKYTNKPGLDLCCCNDKGGENSIRQCNWDCCSWTYKAISIGLKVCLPLKAISFVFSIGCTSAIEEGRMLICELMAFLGRIANSLKCHDAQRVGSHCQPKNQSREASTPTLTLPHPLNPPHHCQHHPQLARVTCYF